MVTADFNSLCSELERQELDAPTGIASVQVYSQLLAIYLYQHDLCNAKFLWKRIPAHIKSSNNELSLIWKVGQCMWKRDYPGLYAALKETWSETVAHIMTALQDEIHKRAIDLVSNAYSSITLVDLAAMAGVSIEEAAAVSSARGWHIEPATQMVQPVRPPPNTEDTTTCEDQLYKLTKYVSFLEN